MKFDEIQIQIHPRPEGFEVAFQSRSLGTRKAKLELPWSAEDIPKQLETVGSVLLRWMHHVAKGKSAGTERAATEDELRSLFTGTGGELFQGLLNGDVHDAVERHWGAVEHSDECDGLRLRLLFDPTYPEIAPIAALPWELLYRGQAQAFIGRLRRALLVRYIENKQRIPDLLVEGDTVRVLLVPSIPSNLRAVDAKTEIAKIRQQVERIDGIELDFYEQPELGELRDRLIRGGHHVLHFMGHGSFDEDSGEGQLAFVGTNKKYDARPAHIVAENLKGLKELRLVVLSSCSGAALPRKAGQSPYLNVAPALVMAGVPAVVAMQFPITDGAANAFSKAFYRALVRADPLDVAMAEARLEIFSGSETSFEWATPALFTRVQDCVLFHRRPEPAPRLPTQSTSPATAPIVEVPDRKIPEHAVQLGIRSFRKGWGKHMEDRCEILDLGNCFDPSTNHRLIFDDAAWHSVIAPRVRGFLSKVDEETPLVLEIAAHNSIAFFAGNVLDAKSGMDVTVRQRGHGGSHHWSALEGSHPKGPLWQLDEIPVGQGTDVALAVSVTHDVAADVEEYVRRTGLSVGRIAVGQVLPQPSQRSITSGAHALELSHQLSHTIRQRSVEERRGVLHLFAAAPAVFMVWLGQQSRSFGAVQLYEHDFESGLPGAYLPSLRLTPPRWHHRT